MKAFARPGGDIDLAVFDDDGTLVLHGNLLWSSAASDHVGDVEISLQGRTEIARLIARLTGVLENLACAACSRCHGTGRDDRWGPPCAACEQTGIEPLGPDDPRRTKRRPYIITDPAEIEVSMERLARADQGARSERAMKPPPTFDDLRQDGLTDEEGVVMDALIASVEAFARLERQHPDELRDFIDGIHRCQDQLAVRICRREYPIGWPIKS